MTREHVQQSAAEWDRRDTPGRKRVWLECGTHDASKLQRTETGEDYCWMCMTLFDGDAALNPPDDQAVSLEPAVRRRREHHEISASRTMTAVQSSVESSLTPLPYQWNTSPAETLVRSKP